MPPTHLFITGATGFIGGMVLSRIVATVPDLHITALLRSDPTPAFTAAYPNVSIVRGTFDDADVISAAARAADVVIHAGDIDHPGCAAAILSGAKARASSSDGKPIFLIHLSGTGCISDMPTNPWDGRANPRVWDDEADAEDIYNLDDAVIHHAIDRAFMDAGDGTDGLIKTIIVAPPDVVGAGPPVGGARGTFLLPMYVRNAIEHGVAYYLGAGENLRAVAHNEDIADLFLIILQRHLSGRGEGLTYGRDGFYFAVAEEAEMRRIAEEVLRVGKEQGWLPAGARTQSWDEKRIRALLPKRLEETLPILTLYLWGSNSRARSTRARKLGWVPKHGFWDTLPVDCRAAAEEYIKRKGEAGRAGNRL